MLLLIPMPVLKVVGCSTKTEVVCKFLLSKYVLLSASFQADIVLGLSIMYVFNLLVLAQNWGIYFPFDCSA